MLCLPLAQANDPTTCGPKAARLAQIATTLPVPLGYVITKEAYDLHVKSLPISETLNELDATDYDSLFSTSKKIQKLITEKALSLDVILGLNVHQALHYLGPLIVRSSSLQEDLQSLSFAGQYDSFKYVTQDRLVQYIKLCWASLYTPRAISYRHYNKLSHNNISMAVIIQEMIYGGVSGVMLTANPNTGEKETLLEFHEEGVVDGQTEPHFNLMKTAKEVKPLRQLSAKDQTILYTYGVYLEKRFKGPLDIEWAVDKNGLHILQVRPLKVTKVKPEARTHSALPILIGSPIGEGLVSGVVQKVRHPEGPFTPGNILVVETTSPEWEPLMRVAKALITDKGSQTSHASMVAREMGLHAIVGTMEATQYLTDGQTVTLDGNDLWRGFVYGGEVKPVGEFHGHV